ncbi:MAG TPA: hypothetical protein PLD47_00185 [Aggregatilineales bacterium]|nr:hypothetical protein [Anaerolineales bacterium]HRE46116.1 hypothetical protein [Aggregatilineales bacterium]
MTFTATPSPTNADEEKTYCAVHPTVESGLKCNKCGRYMCTKCAVYTPVGYRCKQCVNQQQAGFFKALPIDYALAIAVALVGGLLGGFILPKLFLFGVLILSFPAGIGIGEAVWRVTKKRRGKYIPHAIVGAILVGAIAANVPAISDFLHFSQAASASGLPARQVQQVQNEFLSIFLRDTLLPVGLFAIIASVGAVGRVK